MSKPSKPPVPQILKDMRHVARKSPSEDKTQGQKVTRRMSESSPGKFVETMERMERAYAQQCEAAAALNRSPDGPVPASPASSSDPAPEKEDSGSRRVGELVEQLLAELDAELAAGTV